MLKINCPPLPSRLQAYLEQQCCHNSPWSSLSRPQAAQEIKRRLRQVFHDKCGYCEQIEAQTVDHFWPQSTAQARWDWENMVLACDTCQSKKMDRLPVDEQGHQMVNPRRDEPLRFLYFDFRTGKVTPLPITAESEARGRLTIERLAFDRRPQLDEARRRKLWDVLGYMVRIVQPTSAMDAEEAWQRLADHLHPDAPYLGMIRQLFLINNDYSPIISALRQVRPEFDSIIAEWCLPVLDG